MSDDRRRRPWLIGFILAMVALCCAGCFLWVRSDGLPFTEPDESVGLYIRNDRAHRITVRIVRADVEFSEDIPANGFRAHGEGVACEFTLIEAQDEDGRILARANGGGCTTRTWIVAEDGTATFAPGRAERPT